MQQDRLPPPPEPPRQESNTYGLGSAYGQPAPDRRSHDSFNNRFSPSQSYNQQAADYLRNEQPSTIVGQGAPGTPGPGSMRIAGLSEPHLFPSIQPLVVPQTTAQMAPPDLLSQAVPMQQQQNMFVNPADPLGMSQSRGVAPAFRPVGSFPNTAVNAFQTQMPTTFTTQPPMSAVSGFGGVGGVEPTAAFAQPGAPQQFFTQAAVRR